VSDLLIVGHRNVLRFFSNAQFIMRNPLLCVAHAYKVRTEDRVGIRGLPANATSMLR
jgi:hypothetical protein